MYICLDCNTVFNENETVNWTETHGLSCGPYEEISGCPNCRGAYVETYKCDACGEYIGTETYVQINDEKYCENCFTIKNLGEE